MTRLFAVSDHCRLQVCKNPEKTRKKKEALSPAEAIDPHTGHLQMVSPENDDSYPVPQVRATHSPLQPTSLGQARKTPKLKAARKPNPKGEDDDPAAGALPQVAGTSTILAPIGARTDYVGPALLRSRQMGLKRSGSSENSMNGSENSMKKHKSEPLVLNSYSRCYCQKFFGLACELTGRRSQQNARRNSACPSRFLLIKCL